MGRPRKRTWFGNLYSKKSVDLDASPTTKRKSNKPIKPLEPPEQWAPCRLRQKKRELVLKRIRADVEYELCVKKEIKREKILYQKRLAEGLLSKQNGFVDLRLVKVKEQQEEKQQEEQQQVDIDVKIKDCKRIKKEKPRKKALKDETPKRRSRRLESRRQSFEIGTGINFFNPIISIANSRSPFFQLIASSLIIHIANYMIDLIFEFCLHEEI